MRARNHFEMIDTIYEKEQEFSSTSSSSLSPQSSSSSTPPLHSTVKAWSLVSGREADMLILVQGTCFHLHKDRMTTRSSFLKRHPTEVSDFTLSPPLNITADTFVAVAEFCYSRRVMLTASNIAAMSVAAGLLGITEARGEEGENLSDVTKLYFERMIGIDEEYASMSMPLLPEAETTASLVSICIEVVVWEKQVPISCSDVVMFGSLVFCIQTKQLQRSSKLQRHKQVHVNN